MSDEPARNQRTDRRRLPMPRGMRDGDYEIALIKRPVDVDWASVIRLTRAYADLVEETVCDDAKSLPDPPPLWAVLLVMMVLGFRWIFSWKQI